MNPAPDDTSTPNPPALHTSPPTDGRHAVWFILPVLAWLAVALYGGGEGGRYERSWRLLQTVLRVLAPEWPPDLDANGTQISISMYQANDALRRVAHVATYAVLSALVVRAVQRGEPELKRASLVGAGVVCALFIVADEVHRAFEPNRHAKAIDIWLNLAGVGLVVGGTWLFFRAKQWERRGLARILPAPAPPARPRQAIYADMLKAGLPPACDRPAEAQANLALADLLHHVPMPVQTPHFGPHDRDFLDSHLPGYISRAKREGFPPDPTVLRLADELRRALADDAPSPLEPPPD